MNKQALAFIFLLIPLQQFLAQSKVDSLKTLVVKNKKEDTLKVTHYNLLAKTFLNRYPDSIAFYANKSHEIAKKINYTKGLAESYRLLGTFQYFNGNVEKSMTYLDSSLTLFTEIKDLRGQMSAHNNIGLVYKNTGQLNKAIENYNLALKGNKKLKDTQGILNNLVNLANAHSTLSNYKQSEILFNEALDLATEVNDQSEIANIYTGFGILEERRSNFEKAKDFHFKAIAYYEKNKFESNIAISYNNIANIETKQSNYIASIRYFKKALVIAEKIGRKRLQGIFLNNIANNYLHINDNESALKYYLESIAITESIDQITYHASLANIGLIKIDNEEFEEAEKLFKENIEFCKSEHILSELINAYNNLSSVYIAVNDLDLAEENLLKVLELTGQAEEHEYYLTATYNQLARVYFLRSQLDLAINYAAKAYQIAKKIGVKQRIAEATQILGDSYKEIGDYKQALFYTKINKEIAEELFNSEKSKELGRIEVEQEFKAENERIQLQTEKEILSKDAKIKQRNLLLGLTLTILIALLIISYLLYVFKKREQRNNQKLQQANAAIENQNKKLKELHLQKNKLFSIVAHDLRGPLNNLNGMFELAAMGSINDQEIKQLIPEINLELEKTIVLTNNLLEWASQEMEENKHEKSTINVAELVHKIKYLFKVSMTNKKLRFTNKINPQLVIVGNYQTLNLVLRNLISNSIKYCDENDEVAVDLVNDETKQRWVFCVADTGIGMSKELKENLFSKKLFSKKGTNNESGTGLGLILCKDFVEREGGEIWVDFSAPNQGTKICFALPKNDD